MKRLFTILLILVALGLCAISVVQWKREVALRLEIEELTAKLNSEHEARVAAEEQAELYKEEIDRLTKLREEIEARLEEATDRVAVLSEDLIGRGMSISVLMQEIRGMQIELAQLRPLIDEGAQSVEERNEAVAQQNAAIQKQNQMLKELAAERDGAIAKLNAQVKAYNELVEKYNALAKKL